MNMQPSISRRPADGFSLVEVLVTLVITAVGLLGLAGMQNLSLKTSYGSYLRTNANNMAYDIADRMRANRDAALGGRYNIAFGNTPGIGGVAGNDLKDWLDAVETTLPEGEASVTVQSDGHARVRIRWLDNRDKSEKSNADTGKSGPDIADEHNVFNLRTQL